MNTGLFTKIGAIFVVFLASSTATFAGEPVIVDNSKGYMEKNDLGAYSFNNITAIPDQNGSITINFGGCEDERVNCLPVNNGWNYIVRLYQPKDELLEGKWIFPEAKPVF